MMTNQRLTAVGSMIAKERNTPRVRNLSAIGSRILPWSETILWRLAITPSRVSVIDANIKSITANNIEMGVLMKMSIMQPIVIGNRRIVNKLAIFIKLNLLAHSRLFEPLKTDASIFFQYIQKLFFVFNHSGIENF